MVSKTNRFKMLFVLLTVASSTAQAGTLSIGTASPCDAIISETDPTSTKKVSSPADDAHKIQYDTDPLQAYRRAIILGNSLPQTNEGIRLAVISTILKNWNPASFETINRFRSMERQDLVQLKEFGQMVIAMNSMHAQYGIKVRLEGTSERYLQLLKNPNENLRDSGLLGRIFDLFLGPIDESYLQVDQILEDVLGANLVRFDLPDHIFNIADENPGFRFEVITFWNALIAEKDWGPYLAEQLNWIGTIGDGLIRSTEFQEAFKAYRDSFTYTSGSGHNGGSVDIRDARYKRRVAMIEFINVETYRKLRARFSPTKAAFLANILTGERPTMSFDHWPNSIFFGQHPDPSRQQSTLLSAHEKAELLADVPRYVNELKLNQIFSSVAFYPTADPHARFLQLAKLEEVPSDLANQFWDQVASKGHYPDGRAPIKIGSQKTGTGLKVLVSRPK